MANFVIPGGGAGGSDAAARAELDTLIAITGEDVPAGKTRSISQNDWSNPTGEPITVPADTSDTSLEAAGLVKTSLVNNKTTLGAAQTAIYAAGPPVGAPATAAAGDLFIQQFANSLEFFVATATDTWPASSDDSFTKDLPAVEKANGESPDAGKYNVYPFGAVPGANPPAVDGQVMIVGIMNAAGDKVGSKTTYIEFGGAWVQDAESTGETLPAVEKADGENIDTMRYNIYPNGATPGDAPTAGNGQIYILGIMNAAGDKVESKTTYIEFGGDWVADADVAPATATYNTLAEAPAIGEANSGTKYDVVNDGANNGTYLHAGAAIGSPSTTLIQVG